MTTTELEPGLSGAASMVVTEADSAIAMRSGDVPVLATPRLVALAEEATCAAVAPRLGVGETTVGVRVAIDHSRATAIGATATAEASLAKVDSRKLEFDVVVRDDGGQIASGRVTRMVVDRDRFVAGLA